MTVAAPSEYAKRPSIPDPLLTAPPPLIVSMPYPSYPTVSACPTERACPAATP